ncbi:MAG: hypothetical protein H6809_03065 [Phycisphaeraceae bacterium]|nr:hypothetical protein [Phycisphaeraceae bacterium]
MIRPVHPGAILAVAAAAACLSACIKAQNDRLDVAGRMPAALEAGPTTPGRAGDAQSVVSLDRSNWGATEYEIASHGVYHNPTYARRNTRFGVTARASGAYPTVAEALSLPGGPSESEQIYDAVTWPFVIAPATVAVPLGFIVELPEADIQRSPQWEYDRRPGSASAFEPRAATGDPFVDRLGLPRLEAPVSPAPMHPIETPSVVEPAPSAEPTAEPNPAEPAGEPARGEQP